MADTNTDEAGHRISAHTADTIVQAWGPTRAACLGELVAGMAEVYVDPARAGPRSEVQAEVAGADDTEVVLGVLEECLYLLDARGAVVLSADLRDRDGGVTGEFTVVDAGCVEVVGAVPKAVAVPEVTAPDGTELWRISVIVDV